MSDQPEQQEDTRELHEKIQDVVSEHLAKQGGMLTGFIFSADFLDEDGDRSWVYGQAEDQPITTTLGILEWYSMYVKDHCIQAQREFRDRGEDG